MSLTCFKRCRRCGEEKPTNKFGVNRAKKDGLHIYCRLCSSHKSREWYRANPDKANSQKKQMASRAWAAKNPERVRAQKHSRYLAQRGAVLSRNREWALANPDRNRDFKRCWKKQNPERVRLYSHTRRARIRGAKGQFTPQEWTDLRAKYGHRCLGCGRAEPEVKLSPDHVIPLSKGGANDIGNIQPLCIEINGSKKNNCQDRKGTKTTDFRYGMTP